MSDIQNRSSASRGRVSARGGRGGFSSRGGRGGNRSANDNSDISSFEEGEIGQMKKKYSDTLPTLKEMFPDWKDEDLVFALEDSNGELLEAIERISEGNVSQWGEVKKKTTDRTRPKPKEAPSASTETTAASARGTRGRGGIEGRGRVRADRGRGGRGGRAGATTNGTRVVSTAVETPAPTAIPTVTSEWAAPKAEETVAEPSAEGESESTEAKSSVIPEGTKKGWASLFAKPPAPPVQKKPQPAPPVPAVEKPAEPKTPIAKPTHPVIPAIPTATAVNPPKGDLTETNLEQIPDVSAPAPTATAASTIGSGVDPAAAAAAATTPSRFPSSAYPPSATKQGRTPGLQRRVMEQQQAVVMPGNHAVDRAAVQFGSMGLNGDAIDIDENREEAETRAQPPQHSPVAPRASLPPATQTPHSMETGAAGRPAPGLPPVPQGASAESFTDFARYSEPQQKPFDPFTQPVSQPQPQIPEPFANQAPAQPTATTGSEYSPFYAGEQQRFPYYGSYGSYGQSQDTPAGPRAAAGFGVSGAEAQAQIPTTQPPNRYGPIDATNSGHNTPNPTVPGATQQTPAAQHMPGQTAQQHAYGYQYPNYYNNPHYASYMNQMGQQQQQQQPQYGGGNRPRYDDARRYEDHYMQQQQHNQQYGYGSQYGPYAGKGGMYGQPHGAFSYDQQSSSPANTGSFSQAMPSRDSVYGRTGSAQQSDNQSATGANAFGTGMSDVFSRSQGSFGQNPPIAGQPPVAADETKGFEAPKAGGPSPSLAQNRPGSATNSAPGQPQAQTGLPHFRYGGLGGLGHQGAATQAHQASAYGNNYGGSFGTYYANTNRGGWGGNYGH
ncbi:Ubiquitin system component Cue [Penicillium crustosum]|uniref:Ubiquitin system component Cue n=1 Tax=Penicillium crustosum TaxID=36656 RepID=UPI0023976986|nr:Ubiquitin system component Cue [Penicillium crustosum]KAJ5410546.1 Ubiquitin system component Cue [Penicillium crustosum]